MTFLNYKFGACVDTYTECHYLSKARPQLLFDLTFQQIIFYQVFLDNSLFFFAEFMKWLLNKITAYPHKPQ